MHGTKAAGIVKTWHISSSIKPQGPSVNHPIINH
jgi:hypothetical protein